MASFKSKHFNSNNDEEGDSKTNPRSPQSKNKSKKDEEKDEVIEPIKEYMCEYPMSVKISKKCDFLSVVYFSGRVEIYQIGMIPLVNSFIGIDERADIMLKKDNEVEVAGQDLKQI